MSLARIKKGDKVYVNAGKEKGKTGTVLKVFPQQQRAIVDGLNMVKKHIRRRTEAEQGGIREVPAPLPFSVLNPYCGQCNRGVRVGVKVMKDSSKLRVCKKCQQAI
ncbi:MAG: 50S ribosomal protein L24 [Candidatus Omnitrophica bacterium]|nr:50S ribosomal protein L24 [Candidatus Omnitrophota bacterium]